MSITINISKEILAAEGYVDPRDVHMLREAGLVRLDDLANMRLNVCQVAAFLGVGHGRIRRAAAYKVITLGADGLMSMKEVLTTDWSFLKDLNTRGDGQRQATYFYNKLA